MMLKLRSLRHRELNEASTLCLRSKGYWGYDQAFLDACKSELAITVEQLETDPLVIAEDAQGMAGVAHVTVSNGECHLEKLFVDTDRIREGIGKALFFWAVEAARGKGFGELIVEADPNAVPFYLEMGCIPAGKARSGSIDGRFLPRLVYTIS